MRWFYKVLLGIWASVVLASVIGGMVNALSEDYRIAAYAFLSAHRVAIALPILVLGEVTLWAWMANIRQTRAEHDRQRRAYFALCKPAADVRLDDLDPYDRPYYPYIPRTAVPYEQRSHADPPQIYDEQHLVHSLQQGRGFVLLGQPLEGKTRTLYEIVKQLPGYQVVRPMRDRPSPPRDAFGLFHTQRVLLLLDELNSFAQAGGPDLLEFCEALKHAATTWVLAATCQDGAPLGVVQSALGTSLRRFYEDIPLKLGLRPLDLAGKTQLAHAMPTPSWNPEHAELFPTPGYITMAEPMRAMRARFQADLTPEHRDTMRGLKLLASAGILPYTYARLQAILVQLFHRTLHLGDALEALADQDFIRPPGQHDPVQPEPAYLEEAVTSYSADRKPEDDFPRLGKVLAGIGDVEGLLYLGNTYRVSLQQPQTSLEVYDRALALRPEDPDTWHSKGVALGQLGRPADALAAFDRALALRPEHPDLWHSKGVALGQLGRPADALAAFDRALALRPEHPDLWYNKGVALGQLGRPADALAAFDRALALRPEHPDTWHNKGILLGQLGQPTDALAAFDRALALRPEDPDTWHSKGVALGQLGQPTDALAAYDQALALRPEDPDTWYNKGVALRELGQPTDALAAYDQALALRPEDPDTWHNKGLVLRELGQPADALAAYDRALALRPEDPDTWGSKGVSLGQLGRPADALAAFDQALALRPEHPGIWYNKGILLGELGQPTDALAAFDRALALRPEDPDTWGSKGLALGQLGRPADALAAFDQALALRPEHPDIWYNKGRVLGELGQPTDALAAFDQALALRPEDPDTWGSKGLVLRELGQPADALAAFDQALALRPEHPNTWHNKGVVLRELEQLADALAAFDQALALRPEDPDTWGSKGRVLGELGRPADALAAFDQALALRPEDPDTWGSKGLALGQLGRPADALAAFDQALIYYDATIALQPQPSADTRPWTVAHHLANALMDKGRTLTHVQRWQDAAACYEAGIGWWEQLLDAGMAHLTPDFLAGLESRLTLHRQLTEWDGVARDAMQALTYATPLLHAPAPTTRLRAAWASFRRHLQVLSGNELVQLYDALGDRALRVQEGIGLPPDPRRTVLSSMPHPGAHPDHAMERNRQHQQALTAWQALPWWKRFTIKKPTRPTGI